MSDIQLQHVIDDRLYLAQGVDYLPASDSIRLLQLDDSISYHPLCDDFGPMNMEGTVKFVLNVESDLKEYPSCRLMYCVDNEKRTLTNAVFLLGAYLILRRNYSFDDVADCFSWLRQDQYEEYRDATFSQTSFRLSLMDCWKGLEKGMYHDWVRYPEDDREEDGWDFWGMIDIAEYAHYDSPLNGDLHEVVPGKFVAFRGPEELGGAEYLDDARGFRRFSPSFYVDVLKDLGVTTVVRLNEAHYDAACFEKGGIKVVELEFEDCTAPPAHVVEEFFAAADGTDGSVAVHCKAGLGRTGTLIGLWLMRRRGFTAGEAMGWLRIMRPGSVIGEQQHYLCAAERQDPGIVPSGRPEPALGERAGDEEPLTSLFMQSASMSAGTDLERGARLAESEPERDASRLHAASGADSEVTRGRGTNRSGGGPGEPAPATRTASAAQAAEVAAAMERRGAARARGAGPGTA